MEAIGANKVYFQGFKICTSTNGCIKLSFELECLRITNCGVLISLKNKTLNLWLSV